MKKLITFIISMTFTFILFVFTCYASNQQTENNSPRTADITLNSYDVNETFYQINDLMLGYSGYEFTRDFNTENKIKKLKAVFKVPQDSFQGIIRELQENYDVKDIKVKSNKAVPDVTDYEIRIDSKQRAIDQFNELISTAQSTEEVLGYLREIVRITEEKELLEGQMYLLTEASAENEIMINFNQVKYIQSEEETVTDEIEWDSVDLKSIDNTQMWKLMTQGFGRVWSYIVSISKAIVIFLFSFLPVFILMIIAFIVTFVVIKSRKNKNKAEKVISDTNLPQKQSEEQNIESDEDKNIN